MSYGEAWLHFERQPLRLPARWHDVDDRRAPPHRRKLELRHPRLLSITQAAGGGGSERLAPPKVEYAATAADRRAGDGQSTVRETHDRSFCNPGAEALSRADREKRRRAVAARMIDVTTLLLTKQFR